MLGSSLRPRPQSPRLPAGGLLLAWLLVLVFAAAAAGAPARTAPAPRAGHSRTGTPAAYAHTRRAGGAGGYYRWAERRFGYRLRLLDACLRRSPRHPGWCWRARRALRFAASRLTRLRQHRSSARGTRPTATSPAGAQGQPAGSAGSQAASTAVQSSLSSGASNRFEMGAVVGSAALYELPWLQELGAHTARMEFEIGTPASQLAPVVEAYARAGIRPLLLAGFDARIPSTAEAQNLATWATAFGPGGSFWRGKNIPASMAVTDIEFGNETNNPYQYGFTEDWYEEPAFIQRAEEYARRLRDAQAAIAQTGAQVGLLGIADQYGGHTSWDEAMFRAVPDLGQRVAGWTVHPYGPKWWTEIDNMLANTQAHGAPSTIPVYVTEWGVSSDNGRCLSDNYGWNPCMTYQEAASALDSTVAAMRARYGTRLRALYVFQARDQRASGTSSDREYYFGALQSNQASKGPYTAEVQGLLAANP